MIKILLTTTLILAGAAQAANFSCRVAKPCSQLGVTSFNGCIDQVFVKLHRNGRADLYGSLKTPQGQPMRPFILRGTPPRPGYVDSSYRFAMKAPTSEFWAQWDGAEHWLRLYSNNRQQWGGRLAIDEDASWRVQCRLLK